jgi:hypothetical protein
MKWLWAAAFWMQKCAFQAFPLLAPSDILRCIYTRHFEQWNVHVHGHMRWSYAQFWPTLTITYTLRITSVGASCTICEIITKRFHVLWATLPAAEKRASGIGGEAARKDNTAARTTSVLKSQRKRQRQPVRLQRCEPKGYIKAASTDWCRVSYCNIPIQT